MLGTLNGPMKWMAGGDDVTAERHLGAGPFGFQGSGFRVNFMQNRATAESHYAFPIAQRYFFA